MTADKPKPQIDKFIEAARAASSDESAAKFDATLAKIAKAPPPPDPKPKSRKAGKTEAPE
ncbi:MAG: hypothetical protein AB7O38_25030 [Pirellulaceae bacterium]